VNTEVANAQQTLVNAVNTPAQALLGHPLIGTGQAAAGVAAANAGDFENSIQNLGPFEFTQSLGPAGVYESLTLNTPFGPAASLSLSGIPIFPSNGILGPLGLVVNGTGTVSTPFGPLVWLSANGSEWIYPGGPTYASLSGLTPLGPEAVTLSGTTANGVFQITGGTFSTLGLEFYFQGTQFGFVPEFLEPFGFGP
jgi:hypothetical protein